MRVGINQVQLQLRCTLVCQKASCQKREMLASHVASEAWPLAMFHHKCKSSKQRPHTCYIKNQSNDDNGRCDVILWHHQICLEKQFAVVNGKHRLLKAHSCNGWEWKTGYLLVEGVERRCEKCVDVTCQIRHVDLAD